MSVETTPQTGVPGVPAGIPATPGGSAITRATEGGRLPSAAGPVPKPPFGGNVGRKRREDGLKPGSPEAIAADRKRDAERKQRERAEKLALAPAPALPPSTAAVPVPGEAPLASPAGPVAGPGVDPLANWTPEDFRDAAPELVELAEAWRVEVRTKQAAAGGLSRKVVEEYASKAAFPAGAKRTLSNSSPLTLAKMFNALHVPLSLKAVVTTAPAIVYLIVRDLQVGSAIAKQVADEKERRGDGDAEKKA